MKQKATQITYEKYTIDEKNKLIRFQLDLDVFNFLLSYYSIEIPKCYCFNCFIN